MEGSNLKCFIELTRAGTTSAKWEAYSQLKVKRVKLVVDNMAAVFSLPAT